MYPRLLINETKLIHNIKFLTNELSYLKELYVVTKGYNSYLPIIDILYNNDIRYFAESKINNIKKIKDKYPNSNTLLLRLPMHCEVDDVVKYANTSLNSELSTIELLNNACKKYNIKHEIILMFDLGDLREGIMYDDDYLPIVAKILKYDNIVLKGIGTNVTCYGAIIPTIDNLTILANIKEKIENHFKIELPIISGGNSSGIILAQEKKMPKSINSLRIGDAFIRGIESSYLKKINGMENDVFLLEAQIIEVKEKPSLPIGTQGVNAFGKKVEYDDVGYHIRAIIALGRQELLAEEIIPVDENIKILGSSSDHMILEIPKNSYKVGDIVCFKLEYGAIMNSFTSQNIHKVFVK